jgi:tetratricopeptide (TPR) repeat protein
VKRGVLIFTLAILCWVSVATAQEKSGDAEKLGKIHFAVSCLPDTQLQFDRATAMLHSFWYPQGFNAFTEIAKTDPGCAMAYWGMAISRRGNPLVGAPSPQVLKDGLESAGKAKLAEAKTQRERDYIAAIGTYYNDWEKRDYRTRVLAYEKAMEDVYLHYPEDPEAAVFYALAMNEAITVLPADPNFTRQLKAGAILEKVLAANPEHPGALHYLIHSYDFPALADRGLVAARQYGDVAPSAPHALHMPSHVYSMLGMWQDSIKSNKAALSVAKGYAHALDFMVYAYLQMGQDIEAKHGVERSMELQKSQGASGTANPTGAVLAGYTALAAIPARYAIERGAWAEAATLEPLRSTPVADAITYFTRAMGLARSGDGDAARKNIEGLRQIEDGLRQGKDDYWAQQVEIQRQAATAWVAFAEGRKDAATKLMRTAADLEDGSEKHVAMENRLWPMRELLGDLLVEANEPGLALKEYEASLQSARNRYRGFYGAAKAAQRSGDLEKARIYYGKLVALCSNADTQRPELTEAKNYLAQK